MSTETKAKIKEMDLQKLSKKFPEDDIEWRVQQAGMGKNGVPWALIIPYITNRAIQQRLDDVCGPGNWENLYTQSPCGKGWLCGIKIFIDGKWVTRWDGAEVGDSQTIDNVKAAASNSMKRAGVQWGIGRYLYQFDAGFADCILCDYRSDAPDTYNYQYVKQTNKNAAFGIAWRPKSLERWALPISSKDIEDAIAAMRTAETTEELYKAWKLAYNMAVSEVDEDMLARFTEVKGAEKDRLNNESKENQAKVSKETELFIRDQIEVIEVALNESTVKSQATLAISTADKILSATKQGEAIKSIKDAAEKRIAELQGQNNGN